MLEYKGVVTTNVVAGTGFFSDFAAGLTDFFGGRSGTYKRQMSAIYEEAMEELTLKATQKGANAIIGFRVDYDNISAKNMSMFMISMTGTAVSIQENNCSGYTCRKEGFITMTSLKNEINKRHIIDVLAKKKYISETDWELVFQNPVGDYAKALCKSASDYKINNQVFDADEIKYYSHLGDYLSMIERKVAIEAIYSIIDTAPLQATRLIKAKSLFDAKSIQKLINSGNLTSACNILDSEQDVYTRDDLKDMEKVVMLFDSLPNVGSIAVVKGGVLSKEKERYICQHGHYNGKDEEFCSTCGENIKGLTSTQIKSIEAYRKKVESLKYLFQIDTADLPKEE